MLIIVASRNLVLIDSVGVIAISTLNVLRVENFQEMRIQVGWGKGFDGLEVPSGHVMASVH